MSKPPSPTTTTSLRDPALLAAIDAAVMGEERELFEMLTRKSGLPGPRPNFSLAAAVAEQIATHGRKGNALVRELCAMDEDRAPADTSREFLPVCGALALSARWKANVDRAGAMAALQAMSEDNRRLVREAVVLALRAIASTGDESFLDSLSAWTDGYLQAVAVLDALSDRHVLDRLTKPEPVLARMDEAFRLAEGAPRAHQRSQGYRVLVKVLGEAPAMVMSRFPDAVAAWLEERAATKSTDLRESIERGIERARKAGHGEAQVEGIARVLDESAPKRRDPLTYVGPTRGRGRKRR